MQTAQRAGFGIVRHVDLRYFEGQTLSLEFLAAPESAEETPRIADRLDVNQVDAR
jgi:hypothetical protein